MNALKNIALDIALLAIGLVTVVMLGVAGRHDYEQALAEELHNREHYCALVRARRISNYQNLNCWEAGDHE